MNKWTNNKHAIQKVGWLYGYYTEDKNFEEGVRAIVEAIYEPP